MKYWSIADMITYKNLKKNKPVIIIKYAVTSFHNII